MLQRHFIDVLNNNRMTEVTKEAHRQNFNKCPHCGCIVIKRLINFQHHVLQCQKTVKQIDGSKINPLEDSLAGSRLGSTVITAEQNLSLNPRTAHKKSSNIFISTSRNTDAAESSRSRFLHLSSNEDFGKISIDQEIDSAPK